ncbi:MAG: nucleoside deaminase [Rhodobacteraceae bacterium]|jgi:creatinine deaminase|nr:nucleoside deaminase [Paracoccaceae bacterium]
MLTELDQRMLKEAYAEAVAGYNQGGLPIGAILARGEEIIGRGHNQRVQKGSPILHAEMDCYQEAGRLHPSVYKQCTLYTTLSPCYMCGGTTLLFGVPRMVVGEMRTIEAADDWLKSQGVEVILADDPDCYALMQKFISEHPDIWAEDIGNAGIEGTYHSH